MGDDRLQPETSEIEERLLRFIRGELLATDTTVGRNDDLLSGELLDSVGMLRLAAFVDEEFQIGVQPSDYVIENFQNVALLAAYVGRALERAGGPPADSAR